MIAFITTVGIGLLTCILGMINMMGNLSSLHWYHRQRVTEENRKPYGKQIGIGTVIIGSALIVSGTLFFIHEKTGPLVLVVIGVAALIIGIALGMIVSLRAMKKYNGGIF